MSTALKLISFTSFSMCKNGKISSCKHSADEVMDFANSSHIENKINELCNQSCQKMKTKVQTDLEDIQIKATILLRKEQIVAEEKSSIWDTLGEKLEGLEEKMNGLDTEDFREEVREYINKANIDEDSKKQLIKNADSKGYTNIVQDLKAMQGKVKAQVENIKVRMNAFKEKFPKMTKAVKAMGSPVNVAKTSEALGGITKAIGNIETSNRLQGWAKEWTQGCVNPVSWLPLAAGASSRNLGPTF